MGFSLSKVFKGATKMATGNILGGIGDITSGGKKKSGGGYDFTSQGPQRILDLIKTEQGPGGYLSPGQTSIETGATVRGVYNQGRQQFSDTLNGLGASGLSRRYALPIAKQAYGAVNEQANEALAASMGESNLRRYSAMMGYVNALNQTEWAGKELAVNYDIAKKGADATEKAGMYGGIGQVAGSALGMMAMFSDRRMKKNIEPVGIEGGQKIYEFEYKGAAAKQLPGRYRGVMADEVEKTVPQAVSVDARGRKLVDYNFLGTKMKRVA